jgi:osmoprotectant transport system substrate-binding protein
MRQFRRAALGAAIFALIVSACSLGGGSQVPKGTIASQLVLAGPPECPERPFCLKGLTATYGITFKEFKATDAGGPITVEALKKGDAQVGLLFTSDPGIAVNGFVLLQDDKQLQLADNLVPVVRQDAIDANPVISDALNAVMAKLDQATLTDLNKQVTVDGKAAAEVATAWVEAQGFSFSGGSGNVTVGSTNFYEQEILGEIYAQVLEQAGVTVERKFQLGNREIVFPALESGEIDILAEYAATVLEFVNKGAGEASTDPKATVDKLNEHLAASGLVALDYATATDQNGFVVTRETADTYGLVKISDLAKPAP